MGSVESGLSFKRDQHILGSSSRNERHQKPRSRLVKLVSFKKIYHLQWICTVAVFFSFVIVFQMFLPSSVVEESDKLFRENEPIYGDFNFSKEFAGLDFGEDIQFEPSKVLAKFQKQEDIGVNGSLASRRGQRFGHRKPQLAMVFADMSVDPHQIQMATVAAALREIGYEIQIYSLGVGPADAVWRNMGFRVDIRGISAKVNFTVDWLNYDAILVNSIEVVELFTCLMQDPFKSVPLLWTIHDRALAIRLRQYIAGGQIELVDGWKKVFRRATVVVFPNYALPVLYSACDSGNYFVIPGSPVEAWEATILTASTKNSLRVKMDYGSDDFVIAIVGSQLVYRGIWVDHALVLGALLPLLEEFPADIDLKFHLKIAVLSGHSTGNYSAVVETITLKLGYPKGIVKLVAAGEDTESALAIADLVLYGSLIEELSFPEILIKAMCSGIPVIAPDLSMIKKYVDDRVNGYLYPKENFKVLTRLILQVVSNGKISSLARNIASIGQRTAKNLMVSDSVEGYALLLGNVLKLPSEVESPRAVTEIPPNLKSEWQWHIFEVVADSTHPNKRFRSYRCLENVEKQWNHPEKNSSGAVTAINESFLYQIWEDEKSIEIANAKKRREDEELKDRTDRSQGTWEEVYRSAKRADRSKNDLHERDEGELERTGQPLCIYEPYFGQGTWPFLHHASLYRGLGLSTKGRRPGADDVDGPSRLPLLNKPYYRDTLSEHGAFFAIANRIDRIHKNAWIGFQSWRATARMESLSKTAESTLLKAIQARRHGDTLYFWACMDRDPRNPLLLDFWSFCDAINAGNCKFAFSEALRRMYGIKSDLRTLPPMPVGGDTWSVMHSWVLPTRSFLEFVMFSRMFVDALDAEFYDEHHQTGRCYLSLSKDKHCYSRVLELLINVWAYHSARRMVYINPETGVMQEHHRLMSRRGQMWIKWFQFSTLKSMDEDLAEESDSDQPKRRWLWPSTGEVFWQGVYEKEKTLRNREKEKRRQQSKDKISRIRRRARQKVLGKYVKPPLEDMDNSNRTVVSDKLSR